LRLLSRLDTWLRGDAIAVAWGLAGDQHAYGFGAAVEGLMLLAWGDFESFAGFEDEVVTIYFEGQFSFEDEEELARVEVGVAGFTRAGRHKFFDDTELGCFDEMPAVAIGGLRASPFVVFGGFCADDLGWHGGLSQRE
jgi:hypothetical protein